jgi:hypothetical protein
MEEKFNVKNSYDKNGREWPTIRSDLYYELEVATKVSFDQRQVLQIRAALKDCQRKLEAIFKDRLAQIESQLKGEEQ